ncbi:MAG: hypothetical protein M3179_08570 [Actinomycetota bacterium]|nr:hypothetical protein [Actinomycetota bacterium]
MQSPTMLPPRHLVDSFPSYGDAASAVESLSDDGFPVEQLTIVVVADTADHAEQAARKLPSRPAVGNG